MSDKYTPLEMTKRKTPYADTMEASYHEVPGREALFAATFVERWGMTAGVPDGEDSAGRQTVRLATPEELVARAIKTTELLFGEFKTRGWLHDVTFTGEE